MASIEHKYNSNSSNGNTKIQFVQGFEGNPFARIHCLNIADKICSGACGDCKKEREKFKNEKMKELSIRNTSGDPHFSDVYGDPHEVWEAWMIKIESVKELFRISKNARKIVEEKLLLIDQLEGMNRLTKQAGGHPEPTYMQ